MFLDFVEKNSELFIDKWFQIVFDIFERGFVEFPWNCVEERLFKTRPVVKNLSFEVFDLVGSGRKDAGEFAFWDWGGIFPGLGDAQEAIAWEEGGVSADGQKSLEDWGDDACGFGGERYK